MNILKALFGFKENQKPLEEHQNSQLIDSSDSEHIPTADLFIDHSNPEELESDEKPDTDIINNFLKQSFYEIGIKDGFTMHSKEAAQSGKRLIKSNFRNLLEQLIDENNEEIFRLNSSAIDVADLSSALKGKLENKIAFLNKKIDKLNGQKALSSQDEGLVMSAINDYHQGFIFGLNDYMEMGKLITKTH